MRRYFLLMGALVLMLAMIAACGDDDDGDDTDIADDVTATMPDTDDEATEDDADVTATTDDGEATGTEADAGMTGTESDGAAGTMDADATGTDDDDDADDGTETDDDAAGADDGTEAGDDAAGTEDDDMDDATGTEDDDADDADATDADDDSAEATAGDGDDGDDGGIGEPVTIGDFVLTVNDVMELDSGGVVAPDEGNKFLGVEMTLENTGSDAIGLSQALLMTKLEDDDGQQYEVDLAATAIAIFSGGFDPETEIGPGSEITGVAGFQVPEDVSPDDLTLVITPDVGEQVNIPLDGDDDTP